MNAIVVHAYGGPEVLSYESVPERLPGPGELLIANRAIGVNFIDTYFRSGVYKAPQLPFVPGNEGAGEVVIVGEGVSEFTPGDRVAYTSHLGAYADQTVVPAELVVKLPGSVGFEMAAASLLKGLTAEYLLHRTFDISPGNVILIHAAAGGVGLILTQWAKHLGATVIATAGSPEKVELVRSKGADHVIDYTKDDFVTAVRDITGGRGVDVVYDGVGKATYPASLDVLRPLGLFVSFGNASGVIDNFDILLLGQKGSLFVTRPTLGTFTKNREILLEQAERLFHVIGDGAVQVAINGHYPLAQAADAHRALQSRQTTGATVLLPT
ncbi:quinone oxidoreductase family protein [Pseudochelatococcus contaminans]|uniref:NADPH2:quinone reductase n=1 Tax=Pseudochelatococcus contaminans TaxID=1538103 RepID=A0A7W5Z2V8_9HYPH|nr:quinone oxidoreductase [Pseudochelatococcus contaminans]MBB3809111.1 NADPH2:quinone reductase [Pseudochelatococcus contaminans]